MVEYKTGLVCFRWKSGPSKTGSVSSHCLSAMNAQRFSVYIRKTETIITTQSLAPIVYNLRLFKLDQMLHFTLVHIGCE